ncbi:MAG: hypothetical protein R3C10_08480 [Pirellulales bacterium]
MRQIGRCRPLCPCAAALLRADGGRLAVLATLLALSLSGCQSLYMRDQVLMAQIDPSSPVPRELAKISFPEYRVAPPDVLLIDAVKVIPKSPTRSSRSICCRFPCSAPPMTRPARSTASTASIRPAWSTWGPATARSACWI